MAEWLDRYQSDVQADWAESIAGIRRGLDQMERGEGSPASEVFGEIRRDLGIARD